MQEAQRGAASAKRSDSTRATGGGYELSNPNTRRAKTAGTKTDLFLLASFSLYENLYVVFILIPTVNG